MPDFDASNAQCHVFTFKEGILSAVAHDLKIQVDDFAIHLDEGDDSVSATFNPRSMRVICAMHDGQETPGVPGDKDRKTIEESIQKDVLHTAQFGEIRYVSEAMREREGGFQIKGTLHLHGRDKRVVVDVREHGGGFVAEATVDQPDFGIKPFSAMLGTLKIKPQVKIRVAVPKG